MKMTPDQSLGRLLPLLGLFLAIHEGVTSRPPEPAVHSHNATGLQNANMPASKPDWKNTTVAAVIQSSNKNTSAVTATMSLDSEASEGNGTITTTGSMLFVGNTATSNSAEDMEEPVDNELSLGPTTSSPVTKATTATTAIVNTDLSTVKADSPSMTPTTLRAKAPEMVSPRNNPVLASTLESGTLGKPFNLKHSKKTMAVFFSSLVAVVAFVIVLYALDRCKQKKTQYLHRPLYNNSEETGDRFVPADDTLVISGGPYDGPRVYNPTMTTAYEDKDFHGDQVPFPSRSTQFQLKLLREDGERPPSYEASTCRSSPRANQDGQPLNQTLLHKDELFLN